MDSHSSLCHKYLHSSSRIHSCASDLDLHENSERVGRVSNWSKFSATAALEVTHKCDFEWGKNILDPLLPSDNNAGVCVAGSAFSEGGALYALGFMEADCGRMVAGRDEVEA